MLPADAWGAPVWTDAASSHFSKILDRKNRKLKSARSTRRSVLSPVAVVSWSAAVGHRPAPGRRRRCRPGFEAGWAAALVRQRSRVRERAPRGPAIGNQSVSAGGGRGLPEKLQSADELKFENARQFPDSDNYNLK